MSIFGQLTITSFVVLIWCVCINEVFYRYRATPLWLEIPGIGSLYSSFLLLTAWIMSVVWGN